MSCVTGETDCPVSSCEVQQALCCSGGRGQYEVDPGLGKPIESHFSSC